MMWVGPGLVSMSQLQARTLHTTNGWIVCSWGPTCPAKECTGPTTTLAPSGNHTQLIYELDLLTDWRLLGTWLLGVCRHLQQTSASLLTSIYSVLCCLRRCWSMCGAVAPAVSASARFERSRPWRWMRSSGGLTQNRASQPWWPVLAEKGQADIALDAWWLAIMLYGDLS